MVERAVADNLLTLVSQTSTKRKEKTNDLVTPNPQKLKIAIEIATAKEV